MVEEDIKPVLLPDSGSSTPIATQQTPVYKTTHSEQLSCIAIHNLTNRVKMESNYSPGLPLKVESNNVVLPVTNSTAPSLHESRLSDLLYEDSQSSSDFEFRDNNMTSDEDDNDDDDIDDDTRDDEDTDDNADSINDDRHFESENVKRQKLSVSSTHFIYI